MKPESRADYFRKRRQTVGQLNVSVPMEKLKALNAKLKIIGKTKTQWINEKIDEEIGE